MNYNAILNWHYECHLDNFGKRCNMSAGTPPAALPQKAKMNTLPRRPNMNAKVVTFSSRGDTTLLEYDPATADMEEVNRVIAEYEAKTGAQPFDMATGERIDKVTRDQNEVLMVHPIAGG
jgi:hypothetical protein